MTSNSSEPSEPKDVADNRQDSSHEHATEARETAAAATTGSEESDVEAAAESIPSGPWHPEQPPQREAEAHVAATASPAESKRRSGAGLLTGLAIGLVLLWLLAIGAGLWLSGLLPGLSSQRAEQILALPDRVAVLERQVRELSNRPASAPDAHRLDAIEAEVKRLESSMNAPRQSATDPALLERLEAVEARTDQVLAAAKEAASRAQTAAETAQKASAEAPPNPVERGDLDAVAQRFAGLVDGVSQRVAGLERRITGLDQQIKANEDRFGRLGPGTDRPVRVAIAALELRLAVERGAPFIAELAAAEQVAGNPSDLEPLRAFANTGVPSVPTLAQNLSKLAPAMLQALGAKAHGGGIIERLEASAERLVRIRPVEESAGDAPSIVISRAEIKANRGDIAGAVAELEKLPDPARASASDWIKAAKGRVAAIEAARQFTTQSLDAVVKSAG